MSMLVFLQILHSAGGWAKTVESGLEGGAQEWRITVSYDTKYLGTSNKLVVIKGGGGGGVQMVRWSSGFCVGSQ